MARIDQSYFQKKLETDEAKGLKKSNRFNEMLEQHLQESRSQSLQSPDSRIGENFNDFKENIDLEGFDPQEEFNAHSANLETFLESDDFYKKGLKNQTLAETFSSRVGSTTDERVNKFKHLISAKAEKYDLDPNLLAGLVKQESNFNPYAVSKCGAMGLGQLMPETARSLGVKDPFNAAQNLDGAAKYLKQQLDQFGGNVDKALAAYNAGPGAVMKYHGVPPYAETQNYVKSIKSHRVQIANADYFQKSKPDLA